MTGSTAYQKSVSLTILPFSTRRSNLLQGSLGCCFVKSTKRAIRDTHHRSGAAYSVFEVERVFTITIGSTVSFYKGQERGYLKIVNTSNGVMLVRVPCYGSTGFQDQVKVSSCT